MTNCLNLLFLWDKKPVSLKTKDFIPLQAGTTSQESVALQAHSFLASLLELLVGCCCRGGFCDIWSSQLLHRDQALISHRSVNSHHMVVIFIHCQTVLLELMSWKWRAPYPITPEQKHPVPLSDLKICLYYMLTTFIAKCDASSNLFWAFFVFPLLSPLFTVVCNEQWHLKMNGGMLLWRWEGNWYCLCIWWLDRYANPHFTGVCSSSLFMCDHCYYCCYC